MRNDKDDHKVQPCTTIPTLDPELNSPPPEDEDRGLTEDDFQSPLSQIRVPIAHEDS